MNDKLMNQTKEKEVTQSSLRKRNTKELRLFRYFIKYHTKRQQEYFNYLDQLKVKYQKQLKESSQKSVSKQIRLEIIKLDREKSRVTNLISSLDDALTTLNTFEQFEGINYQTNQKEAKEYLEYLEERMNDASNTNRSK